VVVIMTNEGTYLETERCIGFLWDKIWAFTENDNMCNAGNELSIRLQ